MVNQVQQAKVPGKNGKRLGWGPLIKEFGRTVRDSLPRFISLSIILLLGTAFFAGMKATAPNMSTTVSRYMDAYGLADFTAAGNFGLVEADVEAFAARPEVSAAEGVMTADVVLEKGDRQTVLRLHSLPEQAEINRPALVQGRLPARSDEVAPEFAWAARAGYEIGQELVLAEAGTEGLEHRCLKLVGLTATPDYLSNDRGNSQAGNGKVAGYAFVSRDLFKDDIYTAVLLKANLSVDLRQNSFEPAYRKEIEQLRPGLEGFLEERTASRRQTIHDEASDRLAEGTAKLEKERGEARRKLQEARTKLDQGQSDYQSGLSKLEAGRAELTAGKRRAEEAFKLAADKLVAGRKKLAEHKALFEKTAGQTDLSAAAAELEKAEAKLSEQKKALLAQRDELDRKLAAWQALKQEFEALPPQQEEEPSPSTETETGAGGGQPAGGASLPAASAAVSPPQTAAGLVVEPKPVAAGPAVTVPETTGLSPSQAAREELKKAYEAGRAAEPALLQAADQIKAGLAEIERGEAELAARQEQLAAGKKQQEQALAELAAGEQELQQGESELQRKRQQTAEQMASAQAELDRNEEKLRQAARDLATGEEQYKTESLRAEQELAKAESDLAEGQADLADLKKAESYLLDRGANIGYASFKQDRDRVEAISLIFPLIFYAVAALISMTTMTRMVEEERGRIGAFHALGYNRRVIYLKYFAYAALAAGLGSGFGLLLGYRLFPTVIYRAYGLLYDLPPLQVRPYAAISLIATALAFLSALGGVLSVVLRTWREKPAELLRPPAPRQGQRIFLEYIRPLWRRLSFNNKVTCRNIFRYKKRMWMTLAGIAGCTALLVMGFGLQDSMRSLGIIQYDVIDQADGVLTLDKNKAVAGKLPTAQLRENSKVGDLLPVYEQAVTCLPADYDPNRPLSDQTYIGNTVLLAPLDAAAFPDFFNLTGPEKKQLADSGDGILLTDKLAHRLGVAAGDKVKLTPSLSANDRLEADRDLLLLKEEVEVTVSGLVENHNGHRIYLRPETLAELCGLKQTEQEQPIFPTKIYFKWSGADPVNSPTKVKASELDRHAAKADEMADAGEAVADLLKYDGVAAVGQLHEEKDMLMSRADQIGSVLLIIILAAGLLAYVVLFNLSNINLTERRRELATLKVLGFTKRELNAYIFRENVILTLLGTLAGLGLGTTLHHYLVRSVEADAISMSLQILWPSFLWSALLTIGFSLLVNLQMLPRLQKIDMVESLKSVE